MRKTGFSLLELLTVLVILGVFAAVSTPAISRLLNSIAVRKKTENVAATLRYARLLSISKGKKLYLSLDNTNGTVFLLSGAVSEQRVMDLTEEESITMTPEQVIFYPESQASPAVLSVVIGNQSREITLDPFTALPLIN
jgi:type II secretion system protein H